MKYEVDLENEIIDCSTCPLSMTAEWTGQDYCVITGDVIDEYTSKKLRNPNCPLKTR